MGTYANQVAGYLFAQSWQIALLIVVVGLISFVLKNKSAHIRYLLWLIVLAKCIVPPVYSIPIPVLPDRLLVERMPPPAMPEVPVMDMAVRATEPIEIEAVADPQASKVALPGIKETAVLVWILGAFMFLVWVGVRAVRYTLWLRNRRSPLPDRLRQILQESLESLKLKPLPRIWLTQDIGQPFVWGLFRGSVYLPVDFLNLDGPKRCRMILAHELSHVTRFDAAINLLQVLAQAIYWFHPFVWWTNRRIRQEREKCCDEMTVAQFGTSPEHYTGAIVEALAAERRSARPIPSLAIVGSIKDIEERITTMMKPGKKFYKRPSLIAAMAVMLIALLTVPNALVLTARAAVEAISEAGTKPTKSLHEAAADGDVEQVKLLISKGADLNGRDRRDKTALHRAARYGRKDVVELLIAKGADINAQTEMGWTSLHEAADWDHTDLVKFLMAKGAEFSPIHMAAYFGDLPEVKNLIAKGFSVNARDRVNFTPMHSAVCGKQKELVEFLITNGADVNAKDNYSWTPLVWGIWNHDTDTVRLLVEKGASGNVHDEDGFTPLTWAVWEEDKDTVELLINNGADINAQDKMGSSPLYYASFTAGKDVFDVLLAKVNKPGTIHFASCKGDLATVKTLIKRGTDVNLKDRFGCMPLHWAVLAETNDVADFLIAEGADVTARDNIGFAPLMVARGPDMIEFLISKGADINVKMGNGRTRLHAECFGGNRDIAEIFLVKGADVNEKDNGGTTPLHLAASKGHMDIVELLLRNKANVNARSNEGRTSLSMAKLNNHTQVVELLRKHGAKD